MLEDLDTLISFIILKYEETNNNWNRICKRNNINLKKISVKNIFSREDILQNIFDYREFLSDNALDLTLSFTKLNLNSNVNTRIKLRNSIEYKLDNYIKNHNNGEGPINKCFNDIFGIRIILENNIEYEKLKEFIDKKYNYLKCIDSSKDEYIATHIYFKRDNYTFPWELQIWEKSNELSNIKSHEKYKQEYVKWEKENKGES